MRTWRQLKTRRQKVRRLKSVFGRLWRKLRDKVGNVWYWLRTHTYNRYHIVDCRSPQNGYRWGWCDREWLMYCACFNILKEFVEKENPRVGTGSYVDHYGHNLYGDWDREITENQWKNDLEIRALYDWWTHGREEEQRLAAAALQEKDGGKRWMALHEYLEKKDDEMLERLMKVRQTLWT